MLQDVFIFSGTILDNITLFDQTISLQDVNNAIKYVNADKFILKMKDGLNTEVSEKVVIFQVVKDNLYLLVELLFIILKY